MASPGTPSTASAPYGSWTPCTGRARRFPPDMAKTRIYFVSDLHGSSVCFRKFINAARIYEAKVLILGGDVAGKAIQSIVQAPGVIGSAGSSAPTTTSSKDPS